MRSVSYGQSTFVELSLSALPHIVLEHGRGEFTFASRRERERDKGCEGNFHEAPMEEFSENNILEHSAVRWHMGTQNNVTDDTNPNS